MPDSAGVPAEGIPRQGRIHFIQHGLVLRQTSRGIFYVFIIFADISEFCFNIFKLSRFDAQILVSRPSEEKGNGYPPEQQYYGKNGAVYNHGYLLRLKYSRVKRKRKGKLHFSFPRN